VLAFVVALGLWSVWGCIVTAQALQTTFKQCPIFTYCCTYNQHSVSVDIVEVIGGRGVSACGGLGYQRTPQSRGEYNQKLVT